jgi:hypothetical protein
MREKFNLRLMISVFVALAALICAGVLLSALSEPNEPMTNEPIETVCFTPEEIRNPEIALKYGITGYLDIVLPADSPSSLSVNRGGEINITILLHFVSYTTEVTEAQVNIDPKNPWCLGIEQDDVSFNDLVSYNPSGNISIRAEETIPVTMSIRIPENLPSSIEAIPLYALGITSNFLVLDELGGIENEVAVH